MTSSFGLGREISSGMAFLLILILSVSFACITVVAGLKVAAYAERSVRTEMDAKVIQEHLDGRKSRSPEPAGLTKP
ncbi:MAG: hypothetical protein A2808_02495 [Candidatus Moranbacteria bacterium RIFCSPHIGHO2_01_FULL_55_24]|nr:MAG: hypothetical protein A2808_02495 [Candidatus Moranbacteria bacterium RIFCSPHIGHO2_01_FULL_55_24]